MAPKQMPGKKVTKRASFGYYISCTIFLILIVAVAIVRLPEFLSIVMNSPQDSFLLIAGSFAAATLFISPPATLSYLVRRVGLLFLVLYQLKVDMDSSLSRELSQRDMSGTICVVTGANSGTGFGISEKLALMGAHVIMACRSIERCENAASKIKSQHANLTGVVTTAQLDLADFASIKTFVSAIQSNYDHVDILINNAGIIGEPGSVSQQGLELSIGVMHFGHFALTKWLTPQLTKPLPSDTADTVAAASRVIYVGSVAYIAGYFHESLLERNGLGDFEGEFTDNCGFHGPNNFFMCCPLSGCPFTNGYARAKLANILHTHELQRRLDLQATQVGGEDVQRRLITASLHPGSVSTNIHPMLNNALAAMVLRSSQQAADVILHAVLSDEFVPGAYIDGARFSHDLQDFAAHMISTHLEAFPSARDLPFARRVSGRGLSTRWSLDVWAWHQRSLLATDTHATADASKMQKVLVAERLWEVTDKIITDWEMKNKNDHNEANCSNTSTCEFQSIPPSNI